jgi:hypothetical protein
MLHSKLILFSLFAIALFCTLGITQAHAYAKPLNIQQFEQDHAQVTQLINFTYSEFGTEELKSMTIKSTSQLTQEITAHDSIVTNPQDDIGGLPQIKDVFNTNCLSMLTSSNIFNFTETKYYLEMVASNDSKTATVNYYDITKNASMLARVNGQTGFLYSAILLPPRDVANYYCQQHGYTLGSVTNISYANNLKNVDFIAIGQSEKMQPDNNLGDGYQAIPVAAPFAWALVYAFAWIIIKTFLIILAGAMLMNLIIVPFINALKPSVPAISNPRQSIDITLEGVNVTALWNAYKDYCTLAGVMPTLVGSDTSFDQFCRDIGEAQPRIYINQTMINNVPPEPANALTDFLAFLQNLGPLIIMIIIIVAFIFGGIMIVKVVRKVSSYIPEPKKSKETNN